jgi:hypothetical protein
VVVLIDTISPRSLNINFISLLLSHATDVTNDVTNRMTPQAFDADASGSIDYQEFEHFLIRCKARMEREEPRRPNAKFDLAFDLAAQCKFDIEETRFLFEDSINNALGTR